MDYKQKNKGTLIVRIKKACGDFRMNKVPYDRFIPWEFMKPGKKYKIRKQRTLEDFEHE